MRAAHDKLSDDRTSAPPQGTTPTRVLVVAGDRRFRAVAATLLARRGYNVTVGGRGDDVVALATRIRADVVVLDASASLTAAAREAARLDALRPRVAVVTVSEECDQGLAALPVLPKWSAFDDVFAAIDRRGQIVSPERNGHGR